MKLLGWSRVRDPACWLLGAGVFVYLVATDNPDPVFIGVVVGLLGFPGAARIDAKRRAKRAPVGGSTDAPSVSSGSGSSGSPSSGST